MQIVRGVKIWHFKNSAPIKTSNSIPPKDKPEIFFLPKRKVKNQQKDLNFLFFSLEMSDSSRSLIPSFLYSSDHHRLFQSPEPSTTMTHVKSSRPLISPTSSVSSNGTSFAIATPNEKVEMYSPAYFAACTVAGMLCCGITHTAITPLDVIKCNMQVKFQTNYYL